MSNFKIHGVCTPASPMPMIASTKTFHSITLHDRRSQTGKFVEVWV